MDVVAPIIWAKWGSTSLEVLRLNASNAPDGLSFEAMNSDAGIRTVLVVCTTRPAQIQVAEEALALQVVARPVEWRSYSVAELIFRTEKRGCLSHQELRDGSNRTALVLCATRPEAVQMLERLCDLPD